MLLQRRCQRACLHLADDAETVEATHGHTSHPGVRSVTAAADSISLPTTHGIDFGAVANQVSFAGIRTLVSFSHLCPERPCVKLLADFFLGTFTRRPLIQASPRNNPCTCLFMFTRYDSYGPLQTLTGGGNSQPFSFTRCVFWMRFERCRLFLRQLLRVYCLPQYTETG